jgi:amidase
VKEVYYKSATEQAALIRNRDISVCELVGAQLARMDAINARLNAVVTRCDEQAMAAARDADRKIASGVSTGALHGVPFTIKDAFDTRGVRTTSGTTGLKNNVPDTDAAVVASLKQAGAILVGKTNTPDLTLLYDTDNLLFGKTSNPYDTNCSPGGSSGGSAASVAAGLSALDIGSDTGGSIRLPAHFCGVCGLKPTAGRVPRSGLVVTPGSPIDDLTQVGPIARSVADLGTVLRVIEGQHWGDPSSIPARPWTHESIALKDQKIAWYNDVDGIAVNDDVADVVRQVVQFCQDEGAMTSETSLPGLMRSGDIFGRLFGTDGGAWLRRILRRVGTREKYPFLDWSDKRDDKPAAAAATYTAVQEDLAAHKSRLLQFIDGFDIVIAPVHSSAALSHEELLSPKNAGALVLAATYNIVGWPVAVVRAGTSADGLPIGVQVVGAPWQDERVLQIASRIENAFGGWQKPPL